MSWLEPGALVLALYGLLALNKLQRIFFIWWELFQRLIVASLGWIRWLEWFIVKWLMRVNVLS